jgi:hypothetical protein
MRLKNIDTSTTAGKIEVMRAYAEGKSVVHKASTTGEDWKPLIGNPFWNWYACSYAVVEEPRVVWGVYDNANNLYTYRTTVEIAEEVAAVAAVLYPTYAPFTVVKLVEEVK